MNFEEFEQPEVPPGIETISTSIKPEYEKFVPQEFLDDPVIYFNAHGKNIKHGSLKRRALGFGEIKEDPTATKNFPVWTDKEGNALHVVAKRVNLDKSEISENKEAFYEYKVLEILQEFGIPAAKPIGKIIEKGEFIFLMEKIEGVRCLSQKKYGKDFFKEEQYAHLESRAKEMCNELEKRLQTIGLFRSFKPSDIILHVDSKTGELTGITPTDWEKTKIDWVRLEQARAQRK